LPCQIDIVRVQEAQRATVILELCPGKDNIKEHPVAVFTVGEDILSFAGMSAQEHRALRVGVDEVIFVEWRIGLQRNEWAPLNTIAGRLREVVTGPCIRIDIYPAQPRDLITPLRFHDFGVRGGVLLDYRELDFGPDANLIVFDSHNRTVTECFCSGMSDKSTSTPAAAR